MIARRRGFIFKAILAVPLLWFSFIGFTVVMFGAPPQVYQESPRFKTGMPGVGVRAIPFEAPRDYADDVAAPPRPDALRFQPQMERENAFEQQHNQMVQVCI